MNGKKNIIDKAWEVQKRIEDKIHNIGKGKYGRIIKMARKPTEEEYYKTLKVTFVGMLVIGGIGFTIYIIKQVVAPWILSQFGI
ncbi:MAG TPA: protein translocase SEC61 complex subunit gamma [Thermoplasmatales archaeon]|nr:protein translocase SEC61 complex subunit gamma [Thermoplasmatales archaeon]